MSRGWNFSKGSKGRCRYLGPLGAQQAREERRALRDMMEDYDGENPAERARELLRAMVPVAVYVREDCPD